MKESQKKTTTQSMNIKNREMSIKDEIELLANRKKQLQKERQGLDQKNNSTN